MKRGAAVLVVLAVAVPLVAAGTVTFHADRTRFHLPGSNAEVNMNLTGNFSNVTVHRSKIDFGDGNFTVTNSSDADTRVDLLKWNLTAAQDTTAVKFKANSSDGHDVSFDISGLTLNADYVVDKDGSFHQSKNAGGNGKISFSNSGWSFHTFTVTEDGGNPGVSLSLGDTVVTEGFDITISCSASDESGVSSTSLTVTQPDSDKTTESCGEEYTKTQRDGEYTATFSATDNAGKTSSTSTTFTVQDTGGGVETAVPTATHGWVGANRQRFVMDDIDPAVGVDKVRVETTTPVSNLDLTVTKLRTRPAVTPAVDNPYTYLELAKEGVPDENISQVSITVTVNRSFAQEHDKVVVSRYTGQWTDLSTGPIETTGNKWMYRANSTGFSFYAVRGTTVEEEPVEENVTGEENVTQPGPVCGNNQCEQGEDASTCPADCGPVANQTGPAKKGGQGGFPVIPVAIGVIVLLIAVGGYVGYRRWRHH